MAYTTACKRICFLSVIYMKLVYKKMAAMAAVKEVYDGAKQHTLEERRNLDTYPLQVANNRVKQYLICRVLCEGQRILDMGCGKGGDGHRILEQKPSHYIGFDISPVSIAEAQRRHGAHGAYYLVGDMLSPDTFAFIGGIPFDVINTQFCLHYVWPQLDTVLMNLANAKIAKRGTVWVGTLVDTVELKQYGTGTGAARIEVAKDGASYLFSLPPLVPLVQEYTVPFPQLVAKMQEYGWKLAESCLFRTLPFGRPLASRPDLQAVHHLYRTFAFVKT